MPHGKLADLIRSCGDNVVACSREWVELACDAKKISPHEPIAAEEILAGPACVLRYFRLLEKTLRQIETHGKPELPGVPFTNAVGHGVVPIMPARGMFDSLLFLGLRAELWLPAGRNHAEFKIPAPAADPSSKGTVSGILGAGNVSSIPATDTLFKIAHEREAVLLKLSPVNDYLESPFQKILSPFIDQKILRMVKGDASVGKCLVDHPEVDTLHITGSHLTHDQIVWGAQPEKQKQLETPLVTKPITSELGNVTPWIVVPGKYTSRQLKSQAEHIATSIANNGSFNCLATKLIITEKSWKQRDEFFHYLTSILGSLPPRYAYYPGARERFHKATGCSDQGPLDGELPWTLIRDVDPDDSPHLFQEESFVCVCAEMTMDAPTPEAFLQATVPFANEHVFGTLCASITVPRRFRKQQSHHLLQAISDLKYGTVAINQWSGVAYGLMTPPWGGYPGATLTNPLSGLGYVHNTFFVDPYDKTVLWGPLCNFPKPVWFTHHRKADKVAWALLRFYDHPSPLRLPQLFLHALTG